MCLGYKGPWLESYTNLFFKREIFCLINYFSLSIVLLKKKEKKLNSEKENVE